MSLWGTLAGIGVGVATGNPVTGAATATAVNSATSGGGGATSCPGQPNAEAAYLLANMSAADRQSLLSAASAIGGQYAYKAIQANDAYNLAFHVAGGDDCKVSSTEGKAFASQFWSLVSKYGLSSGGGTVPLTTSTGPSAIERIYEGVKEYGRAVVGGAVEGAAASAQAGAAGAGTAALGSSLILPLLFGVVIFMLLRK